MRAQAVRALADLFDPILASDRLDAPPGDGAIASRLAALASGNDPRVQLEIIVAVGRLQWAGAPRWLRPLIAEQTRLEPAVAHAAMQALRRSRNWPELLQLLDLPASEPIRPIALRAVSDQYAPDVVDGLMARLASDDAPRRREYSDALARVCKRPGPWKNWGYRPPPRPANTLPWEKTASIQQALGAVLNDPDRSVRLAVLRRMQREGIPIALERLAAWLADERGQEAVAAILSALPAQPADGRQSVLHKIAVDRDQAEVNRLRALQLLLEGPMPPRADLLRELPSVVEDGRVLAALLASLSSEASSDLLDVLVQKLHPPVAEVRAAAIDALASTGRVEAGQQIPKYLADRDVLVRRAAAAAAGRLRFAPAVEPLLRAARDADPQVRRAAFASLGQLRVADAAPHAAAALTDPETQLAALVCLVEVGGPEHATAVMRWTSGQLSDEMALLATRALANWSTRPGVTSPQRAEIERHIREIQGNSGLAAVWHVNGPLDDDRLAALRPSLLDPQSGTSLATISSTWRSAVAAGNEAQIVLHAGRQPAGSWLAYAEVSLPEATPAQFLVSASGRLQVWLNGRPVYERKEPRAYETNSDRFEATLAQGDNRLVVQVTVPADFAGDVLFHFRFRRKHSSAQLEQFMQAALTRSGDVERGRKLFLDAAKTQCIKCHRIGSAGEQIGPELTGVGGRFSRIHLIESILEPSRTITAGYQTLLVRTADGQSITGIRIAEDERTLTLADQKGQKRALAKSDIEALQPQSKSTMPDNPAEH